MDLISSRTIDITKLAMDGLMDRQQAISSNIAKNDGKSSADSLMQLLTDSGLHRTVL